MKSMSSRLLFIMLHVKRFNLNLLRFSPSQIDKLDKRYITVSQYRSNTEIVHRYLYK